MDDVNKLREIVSKLVDSRRRWGNLRHKLDDIIIISLLSYMSNKKNFKDIVEFAKDRSEWLGSFLELPNGIPSKDTIRRVLQRLKPNTLTECLDEFMAYKLKKNNAGNINGKTMRESLD